jgi:hypothetical protein
MVCVDLESATPVTVVAGNIACYCFQSGATDSFLPAVPSKLFPILKAEQDVDTPLPYVVTMRQFVFLLSAVRLLPPQMACESTESVGLSVGLDCIMGRHGLACLSAAAA